jgi:hypothetical protein
MIDDKVNYAYTLQIPGGNPLPNGKRYRELNKEEQITTLCNILNDTLGLGPIKAPIFSTHFEKHKDGRTHVHGVVFGISANSIKSIQEIINLRLGYKEDSLKIFYYVRGPDIGWDKYCTKMEPLYGVSSAKASPEGINNKLIQSPALIECARPTKKKTKDEEFMDKITIDIFKK